MAFGVVLDTCVLYPLSIADILMRLAERELYDLFWSERILKDLERVMKENGASAQQAAHRVDAMRRTFEAGMVSEGVIARLEPAMTNDEGDRHVLAAAVGRGADAVVTANVKHFPPESCEPHGIDVIHPDDFLVSLYDLPPARLLSAARRPERGVEATSGFSGGTDRDAGRRQERRRSPSDSAESKQTTRRTRHPIRRLPRGVVSHSTCVGDPAIQKLSVGLRRLV